jgi:hypothetical protein
MDHDDIGAGLDEIGDVAVGIFYHQVDVQGERSYAAHCLNNQGADGDVGDKVPIHDVDVDVVGTGGFNGPDLFAEAGEIGG